ncbi:MAG: hypothetical protein QOF58_4817 [Pseudonocardiales bacterium]|jgi:hypothetical protein|nr:hypothetical protein [Pseudonocardiales bacterium]
MKIAFASAFAAFVLMNLAACGTDVPAGLADKVNSGCPGLLKPEPVAVITKGHEVSQVASEVAGSCKVSVRDGRDVLSVGVVEYQSPEQAEDLVPKLCPSGVLEADKWCTASSPGSETYEVHGVAGRREVRVKVYELPVNDEVKDAVRQIITDLRNSDKTK